MLQYIFLIYNSTFNEFYEESNDENNCILYPNQEEYPLESDITKKIDNSQNFGQYDAYVKTRAENMLNEFENSVPLDFSYKAIDLTLDSEHFGQNNTCVKTRAENETCMPFQSVKTAENVLNEFENPVPLEVFNEVTNLTQKSEHSGQSNTRVKSRARKMTCMSIHPCKKPKLILNESENPVPLEVSNEATNLTQKSEENIQRNTRVKISIRKKTCTSFHPCKKPKLILNESENPVPLEVLNEDTNLTQKSEENIQSNTRVKSRAIKMTCTSFHPCKKPKRILNESENPVSLEVSNKAINLTQKSEENIQSNTRVKSRARKMTCTSFHPCKKPKLILNESENPVPLDCFNEVIDLTQDLEENNQNDILENESEKSLAKNNTSTLQNLSENPSKHSDAGDKKDIEKTCDPLRKKNYLDFLADEMLEVQKAFLGNNKNLIFYNPDAIQNFQELQKSYQTLDLKGKLSALNSFIKQEFVYDKQFIIFFLETFDDSEQEKNYNSSRCGLYQWKKDICSILSSEIPSLIKSILESSLEMEMKEYLLNYIEFIKISLEHIMKLLPNYHLTSKNIIKLLYWYMRFINEKNIFDYLFNLVGLQIDVCNKNIPFFLNNSYFDKINNCIFNCSNKESYAKLCIIHILNQSQ